jgi:hypothetical protein
MGLLISAMLYSMGIAQHKALPVFLFLNFFSPQYAVVM